MCEDFNQPGASGPPPDRSAPVRSRADRLAEAGETGVWSYGTTGYFAGKNRGKGYEVADLGGALVGSAELKETVKGMKGGGDLSNTQYAVLGLKAAALCGVRPDGADRLWRVVAQRWIDGQQVEGPAVSIQLGDGDSAPYGKKNARARGWGYIPGMEQLAPTGSMTCAGLGVLAVARSEIRGLDPQEDRAIQDAIRDGAAWIARYFSVEGNPDGKDPKDKVAQGKGAPVVVFALPHHFYYRTVQRASDG